jgi:hypothetical protein
MQPAKIGSPVKREVVDEAETNDSENIAQFSGKRIHKPSAVKMTETASRKVVQVKRATNANEECKTQ